MAETEKTSQKNAITDLYIQTILNHNHHPQNFRAIENADSTAEEHNRICGDQLKIYLVIGEGETVRDISFQGSCCAVSRASASMMTQLVKSRTRDEVRLMIDCFQKLMNEEIDKETAEGHLGAATVFSFIHEFPNRRKCASLCWDALESALNREGLRARI